MTIALTLAHVLMCIYLFGGVFARAVLMDAHSVHTDVRLVFWFLGVVALWGIAAPLVVGWVPDTYSLLITLAICAVQCVTGRYWAGKVPEQFCRPECQPRARRATDQTINGGAA